MTESYTVEVERNLLGYILSDPDHYYVVSSTLTQEHFSSAPTRACWMKIKKAMANGGIKDRATFIASIDGSDALLELDAYWATDLPDTGNISEYTKQEMGTWMGVLHEKYIMRSMLSELDKVQEFKGKRQ